MRDMRGIAALPARQLERNDAGRMTHRLMSPDHL